MLIRTLWIFLWRQRLKKTGVYDKTTIQMTVLPVDLDLLMHVNNGMYFSFMDFGRWNMIFSSGIYDYARKNGMYSVVAGETIRFKKSLKLWDKFSIETQVIGNDDKYFYISQIFKMKSDVMATAMVKVRFLKDKGGTVSAMDLIAGFGAESKNPGGIADHWKDFDASYL